MTREGSGDKAQERVEGLSTLSEMLIKNTSITTLDLKNNMIGPKSMVVLCEGIRGNDSLKVLDLEGNQVCGVNENGYGQYDDVGIRALANAITPDFEADPQAANPFGKRSATRITSAKEMELPIPEASQMEALAEDVWMGENTSITALHLAENSLGAKGIKVLMRALSPDPRRGDAYNTSVRKLDLRKTRLGEQGAEIVFQALSPRPNDGVYNAAIKTVDMSDNNIGEHRMSIVAATSLSNLLQPNACGEANTSLEYLNLMDNHLSMEAVTAVGAAFRSSNSMLTLAGLARNLVHLDLSDTSLEPLDLKLLVVEFPHHRCLHTVDFSYNNLGSLGACILAETLVLDLPSLTCKSPPTGECSFPSAPMTPPDTVPQIELGNVKNNLASLMLSAGSTVASTAKAIVPLPQSPKRRREASITITTLSLVSTQICGRACDTDPEVIKGIKSLAVALKEQCSVTMLSLARNYIGCSGAAALASGLSKSRNLLHLDLRHNSIGPEGARALFVALQPVNQSRLVVEGDTAAGGNTALATLDLTDNHLALSDNQVAKADETPQALAAEEDAVHSALQMLVVLSFNYIKGFRVAEILEKVQSQRHIERFRPMNSASIIL
eukprot:gene12732-15056_t